MIDKSHFTFSHNIAIMLAKEKQAYPIPIDEWDRLKIQIKDIKEYVDVFFTISSVLLSIAISAFLSVMALGVAEMGDDVSLPINIIVTWFIFAVSLSCGFATLFFSRSQRNKQKSRESEIVEYMEFIERGFKSDE